VIGGRWSDRVLAKMKEANAGNSYAEVSPCILRYCSSLLTCYADATGKHKIGDVVATTVGPRLCLGVPEACEYCCHLRHARTRWILLHVCIAFTCGHSYPDVYF